MPSPRLIARSAGVLTLAVSGLALVLLAHAGNLEAAAFLLIAPILSAGLALIYPESRLLLVFGAAVLFLGLMPMLFGGYGALYMPSVVLMLWAALRIPVRASA